MERQGPMDPMAYDYANFYSASGEDAFDILGPFAEWYRAVRPQGYYQYELPIHSAPGTRVDVEDTKAGVLRKGLINFASSKHGERKSEADGS